ncbi:MAG: hypothetical protein ACYS1A_02095 [Planctomycetota bacterium]
MAVLVGIDEAGFGRAIMNDQDEATMRLCPNIQLRLGHNLF